MPDTKPNNRDLILQLNSQLTQLQMSIDTMKYDLKDIKDILKTKSAPSCPNGKKEVEVDVKAGWFW